MVIIPESIVSSFLLFYINLICEYSLEPICWDGDSAQNGFQTGELLIPNISIYGFSGLQDRCPNGVGNQIIEETYCNSATS